MVFVDLDLARRLEMAQARRGVEYTQAQGRLRPDSRSMVEAAAGGYLLYAGPGSPVSRAIGLGMHGPVMAADLALIEQFYRNRAVPPRVDLCPLADSSLIQLLKDKTYRLERFHNVLLYPLPQTPIPVSLPPGVRISQAGPEEADLWLTTTAQGFSEQETPAEGDFEILGPNFYSADATCFLAWVDNQPAGGGGMYTHEGVTEFGGASTRPIFRRRGVQTALLSTRLAAAQAMGCDLAISGTSPGSNSQRNLERVGFYLAYTKAIMIAPE